MKFVGFFTSETSKDSCMNKKNETTCFFPEDTHTLAYIVYANNHKHMRVAYSIIN